VVHVAPRSDMNDVAAFVTQRQTYIMVDGVCKRLYLLYLVPFETNVNIDNQVGWTNLTIAAYEGKLLSVNNFLGLAEKPRTMVNEKTTVFYFFAFVLQLYASPSSFQYYFLGRRNFTHDCRTSWSFVRGQNTN